MDPSKKSESNKPATPLNAAHSVEDSSMLISTGNGHANGNGNGNGKANGNGTRAKNGNGNGHTNGNGTKKTNGNGHTVSPPPAPSGELQPIEHGSTGEGLSVIGLGKLGLCMAGVFAEAGYDVIGVDINPQLLSMVRAGEVPYVEPRLEDVLANTGGRLAVTDDYREAILKTDTTFIVVATPTQNDGTYGNQFLESSLASIAEIIRDKDTKHRIVVSCTVMPGTLDEQMIPLVEEISGKKLNEGFSLAYNPEFIAMGNVIKVFTEPDFVLIGESEPEIGDKLEEIYGVMCKNDPPFARMNVINAELTKISLNCYVTTKITYANMLAELCEAIPGANVDVVTKAVGLDARIGSKVLKGGLGFGGPCFPRDNRAFVRLARDMGVDAALANQTHKTNEHQVVRLRNWVVETVLPGARVAILGVAYRNDTPLVDESQALEMAAYLANAGYEVHVHDPLALENAKAVLGKQVSYHDDVESTMNGAHAVVIAMMDPVYNRLTADDFRAALAEDGHVFDLWRLYFDQDFDGLQYHALGVGPERVRVPRDRNRGDRV